jgi:hypothetical protein
MDLIEFAKLNGVTFKHMGPGWGGGPYGYSLSNSPNCWECGFKSFRAAAFHWFHALGFSQEGIGLIEKLLKETQNLRDCK